MTTIQAFLLILFVAAWVVSLIYSTIDLMIWLGNKQKPCEHEHTMKLSGASKQLCYDCNESMPLDS